MRQRRGVIYHVPHRTTSANVPANDYSLATL